jgi:hypothetical protein
MDIEANVNFIWLTRSRKALIHREWAEVIPREHIDIHMLCFVEKVLDAQNLLFQII